MPQKHHGAAAVAVRFRTDSANRRRPPPVRTGGPPAEEKARSDTSLSERALSERSGERAAPADSETVVEGTSHGKLDCPTPDESFTGSAPPGLGPAARPLPHHLPPPRRGPARVGHTP